MNRRILAIVAVLVILAALFFVFRPKSSAPAAQARTFTMTVKNGSVTPDTLTAYEGDTITFHVTADHDMELHLHGYDRALELKKNKPGSETFHANLTGSFTMEDEEAHNELATLNVQPR